MIPIRYRKLDGDGDYSFGKGQQNLTYGTFAVGQAIQTRVALLKSEWWEDTEDGLPLFQSILGQLGTNNNLSIADSFIKQRIIGTKDVTSIEEFSSTYEERKYSFTATVNTKYGSVSVTNSF